MRHPAASSLPSPCAENPDSFSTTAANRRALGPAVAAAVARHQDGRV